MEQTRRTSRKRDAILTCLRGTKSHPTAEWVYSQLKPEIPDLSLGTVYRNLAFFREEGEAVCVETVDGQERFDANTAPHPHFVCTCCGTVSDLDAEAVPPTMLTDVTRNICGTVSGYRLTVYGKCEQCSKEEQ